MDCIGAVGTEIHPDAVHVEKVNEEAGHIVAGGLPLALEPDEARVALGAATVHAFFVAILDAIITSGARVARATAVHAGFVAVLDAVVTGGARVAGATTVYAGFVTVLDAVGAGGFFHGVVVAAAGEDERWGGQE
jgi:hypothetical protein